MSKWFRGILIFSALCLLVVGTAQAGPGKPGSEDGDPYEPEIAVPIGKLQVSSGSVDVTRDAAVTARSEATPNEYKVLFRVYLKLFRIFLR